MANMFIQIHLRGSEPMEVKWFPDQEGKAGWGVLAFDHVRLYLESSHLDQLAQALDALQRERDEQESGK